MFTFLKYNASERKLMNHVKDDVESEVLPIYKLHGRSVFGMLQINEKTLKVYNFHLTNSLYYSEEFDMELEGVWDILAKATNDIRNKYMDNPRQIT